MVMSEAVRRGLGPSEWIVVGMAGLWLGACSVPHADRRAPASDEATVEPPPEDTTADELVGPATTMLPRSANKDAVRRATRPGFVGVPACPAGTSRNHLISWESIRDQYVAALNPRPPSTCVGNLALLYQSVGLPPDPTAIGAACAPANVGQDQDTPVDRTVLSRLNSSSMNLRCSDPRANQSIGGALDVPCSDQRYDAASQRIEITGIAAARLTAFLGIGSTVEPTLYSFQTDQPCGGACSNTHLQTSDCRNDVGAHHMPPSRAQVVFGGAGHWRVLSP